MFLEEFQRKHPNGRTYATGMRSIVPDGPLIDNTDPRWEKAEYEELMYVTDRDSVFTIPPTWTQVSGKKPEVEYTGSFTWKNK